MKWVLEWELHKMDVGVGTLLNGCLSENFIKWMLEWEIYEMGVGVGTL